SDLRTAMKGDDKAAIDKKFEALTQASASIAQQAYAGTAEGAAGAGPAAGGGAADGERGGGQDDNVVDAEFEEVKDDKKAS
ncbi:MAG TPA: molecular chaperone DnaK, partial [Steroidobacteraceae bacterium]|nr:molecular chaperone DnaK [Steroidobacteraceae bacterium]